MSGKANGKTCSSRAVSSSHDSRVVISGLCKSLTSQMTGPIRNTFDEAYRHALSQKASVHDMTLGTIPIMILISCIESGLNACQSVLDHPNPQPVGLYWNPTIAALLRALGQMHGSPSHSSASKGSSKQPKRDVSRPNVKTDQVSPPDCASDTSGCKDATAAQKPSYAGVTKQARAPIVKVDSPPRSPAYQPDESPPKEQESLKSADVDACAIRRELSEHLAEAKGPYIRHLKSGCTRVECSFCREAVRNVAITKCVGHKPCHASGWYPHVGKLLWEILRRKHDKGLSFEPKANPPKLKPGELEPLMYGLSVVGTRDSPKRKADEPELVDVKVARAASTKSETGTVEGSTDQFNWADDVSEASVSTDTVTTAGY